MQASPCLTSLAVSREVPAATVTDNFHAENSSWTLEVDARRLADGYLCVYWVCIHFAYYARWANPLWEALGLDVQREHIRLLASVRESLAVQIARHRPLYWMTAEEAMLPLHGESLVGLVWRKSRAFFRAR